METENKEKVLEEATVKEFDNSGLRDTLYYNIYTARSDVLALLKVMIDLQSFASTYSFDKEAQTFYSIRKCLDNIDKELKELQLDITTNY